MDVLRSFLALYFVDVVGASNTQASFAITVWLGFGLLGDFLLIPLLERVPGFVYLRFSPVGTGLGCSTVWVATYAVDVTCSPHRLAHWAFESLSWYIW